MKKKIVFVLSMLMWFIASFCTFLYTMEMKELMGAIISGLFTMMFGGFIIEGLVDVWIEIRRR